MKQHLTATQSQQLALTPQLRQALAVLQMSATELETELADAVESNPLLEWAEDARPLELADINARNDPPEGPSEAAPGGEPAGHRPAPEGSLSGMLFTHPVHCRAPVP